jgi:uncharacterized protein
MKLLRLPGAFAVCRLAPEAQLPDWVWQDKTFLSLTYTPEELSIVCSASQVPASVQMERNWSVLKVEGPLDFSLTGILSALTVPLAGAEISIFALSTFTTDYLLVKEQDLDRACQVLEKAGHSFV